MLIHTALPEKKNIKYILWDMDGVLVNSEGQHYRAWLRTFRHFYGLETVDFDIYKACIGCKPGVMREIMLENFGIDMDHPEVWAYYNDMKREIEAEEGFLATEKIGETLRTLKDLGYRMAVASSSPQIYIDKVVRGLSIEDCFDVLFSGERVKHSKPAPDTFLAAAAELHADASECVVVEDSENGTIAAKAAGMYCVGYQNPDSGSQNLMRADVVVDEISEILQLL